MVSGSMPPAAGNGLRTAVMAESLLTMCARVSAPILPARAVTDAIGRGEIGPRFRELTVFVVAKAKRSDAVVFDFDHELGRIRRAA